MGIRVISDEKLQLSSVNKSPVSKFMLIEFLWLSHVGLVAFFVYENGHIGFQIVWKLIPQVSQNLPWFVSKEDLHRQN